MIEAVLTFALITAVAEFIILSQFPRLMRIVLRHSFLEFLLHVGVMVLNLWIHWGTMTGTMTGVTAFLVSICVCRAYSWWRPSHAN